jgi:hypothetical protein
MDAVHRLSTNETTRRRKMRDFAKFFCIFIVVALTGCNDHDVNKDYNDNNSNPSANTTVGSDGMIALMTSEPGSQDDYGPPVQSSDYQFEFSSGAAIFAATYEVDFTSNMNVEVWPVWDVAAFLTVLQSAYGSVDLFSEQGMKKALTAFLCSEEIQEPGMAPLACPDIYVSSEPFGYLDMAASFYWPIDEGQTGLVFVIRR